MEERKVKAEIWNAAGKAGAVLGILCVVCMLLSNLVGKIPTEGNFGLSILSTLLSVLIWLAKFVGCIVLMRLFMLNLSRKNPEFTRVETFRFGTATALLSALIVAGGFLCYVLFISPDSLGESFEQVMAQMAPSMDENSRQIIEGMKDRMPVIGFFSQLIYCFLYGWVLSLILSRNIPSSNPFEQDGAPQNPQDNE